MASRKAAVVASLPALLLIGALLLLLVMAGQGAVSEEDAASGQHFHPASLDRAPEPSSLKNSRAVRAGSPVVPTSLGDRSLPSAPTTTAGFAAIVPEEPAPAPQPQPPTEDDCENELLFILIILLLCGIVNRQ